MTIEERIAHHLEESTSGVTAPDRLEEVMAEGRRRRIRRGTFSVLGAAAVVAAVVGTAPLLVDGTDPTPSPADSAPSSVATEPAPTTATTLAPTVGTEQPLGIVVAGEGTAGIAVLDRGGVPTLELPGLDGAAVAYPDQAGGVVYQSAHDRILRLPPGAEEASVLASAPEGGNVVPVGPGRHPDGDLLFFYLEDGPQTTTIVAADVGSGETTEVTDLPPSTDVTAGGSLLAMVNREDSSCPTLSLLDLVGGELASPVDCLPTAAGVSVSADGSAIGILAGGEFRVLAVRSGDVLMEREFPEAYMATAGPGGWAIRTPSETILLATDGETWELPPVDQQAWAIPYGRTFDLGDEGAPTDTTQAATEDDTQADQEGEESAGNEEEATHGKACHAGDVELPAQELPGDVAATRQQLWELASACDSEALVELSQGDETHLSFGGGEDASIYWQNQERMTTLAQLLATRPAHDPDAGLWAWPAVQVDPDDEQSWAEVAELMDPDMVDQMRQAGSYLGYRVGIADDGRWQYFIGGD